MGGISSSPSPCQVRIVSSSDSPLCSSRWYAKFFFSFGGYSFAGFPASSIMSAQVLGDFCVEDVGGVPSAGGAPNSKLKVAPPPTMQCVRRVVGSVSNGSVR